jgi:hypothetical protein
MLVGMSIPITNPRQADLAAQYRPKDTTAPKTSRLNALVKNYLRAAPVVAQTAAANNIFNPFPSIAQAGLEGRNPTGAETGLDAGFLAAGFLPVGKAASQLNSIVKRLNKSADVRDFMTPRGLGNPVSDYANQGLYRPGATGGFTDKNLPPASSEYLFDLVPTEKLSPLREFDRWNEVTEGAIGRGNVKKLMDHLAGGGKLDDPLAIQYFPQTGAGYLAEGNHRLAMAEQLGLEQLPTTMWRGEGAMGRPGIGRNLGDLDVNQLALDRYSNFADVVGERYVPPTMHPYLLKYFQPGGN